MSETEPKKNMLIRDMQFQMAYGLLMAASAFEAFFKILVATRSTTTAATDWFINQLGITGFVIYKIVLTLTIILLCEVVARKRKPLAGILLWLAVIVTVVMAFVGGSQYWDSLWGP